MGTGVGRGTQTPLINRDAPEDSLQRTANQERLARAMRQAQEQLRVARAGESGRNQPPAGTPLHLHNPILQRQTQSTTPTQHEFSRAGSGRQVDLLHLSRESSIGASRRELYEGRMVAWEKEADGLEVSISKVRDKPTVTGIKLLRHRKEELERKALTAHSIFEDVLSSN